eukprot:759576-Hanusia_phi.AAC.1
MKQERRGREREGERRKKIKKVREKYKEEGLRRMSLVTRCRRVLAPRLYCSAWKVAQSLRGLSDLAEQEEPPEKGYMIRKVNR